MMATRTSIKKNAKTANKTDAKSVGQKIIESLEEAIAWSSGKPSKVRVTVVSPPMLDVKRIRLDMGLSQVQFAAKFGFPPATLKNWEQGRARPDASTRVLLAVIAKHPKAVEDVLDQAS